MSEVPWFQMLFLLGLIAAWSLIIIATVRFTLNRCFKNYDNKFQAQEANTREIEKDILKIKADLPLNYIRREDHIRFETVIYAKMDKLADMMELIKDRWRSNDEQRN